MRLFALPQLNQTTLALKARVFTIPKGTLKGHPCSCRLELCILDAKKLHLITDRFQKVIMNYSRDCDPDSGQLLASHYDSIRFFFLTLGLYSGTEEIWGINAALSQDGFRTI